MWWWFCVLVAVGVASSAEVENSDERFEKLPPLLLARSGSVETQGTGAREVEGWQNDEATTLIPFEDDDDEVADEISEDGEVEARDDEEFDEVDLIDFVEELERQADAEEYYGGGDGGGALAGILDVLHGNFSTTLTPPAELNSWPTNATTLNHEKISENDNGDLQLPSDDISHFPEEILGGITAGIEESLRMSDDPELGALLMNHTFPPDNSSETRQFSVYLFQGQYYSEPRLNRFIDGALRNMGAELRVASMDPLYFRVLPRGQVAAGDKAVMPIRLGGGIRRRRPLAGSGLGAVPVGRHLVKRQVAAFFRPMANKLRQQQKKIIQNYQVTRNRAPLFLNRRRNQRLQQMRQRRRRQRIQKLRQQQRRKKQQQQQLANKRKQLQRKRKQQQILLNRIRRRIRQDVGGGRIEGLSRVTRDGDAEMQLFGNYTLIRSHMRIGPVEVSMQFRTKNGIRRSGATIPVLRAHTVTRVNNEGSEMIDYLLDRPQPESIRVRGALFPRAQRLSRGIFAKLFLPNSFLVQKLREKTGLAFLSKPIVQQK